MLARSALLLLIAALNAAPSADHSGQLAIRVTHLRDSTGCVRVGIWNQAAGFPLNPQKVFAAGTAPIHDQCAIVYLENVPAGTYAASAFHDENDNGKLDTNLFHIPKEGFGFSNDARARMGPPSFADAAFVFNGTTQTLEIGIHYIF